MSLTIEGLLRGFTGRRPPIENARPPQSAMPDTSVALRTALTSIQKNARAIADRVRKYGEKKFGPMWAQGYAVLPDGRIVFLQQSKEGRVDQALEINIPPSPTEPGIHIRYDLEQNEINTYETRNEDGTPICVYWIYDRPKYESRFPAGLTLSDIIGPVETILTSVANASKKITWMRPEPAVMTSV